MLTLKTLLCAAVTLPLSTAAVMADSITEREQHYGSAKTLMIDGLAAELTVRVVPQPGVRVRLSGPTPRLRAINLAQNEQAAVLITDRAERANSAAGANRAVVNSNGNRVVVSSAGDRHRVVVNNGRVEINGKAYPPGSAATEPLRVTVEVAADTAVRIEGFVGNARIDDLSAPLHLSMAGGDAELGRLTDATLLIDGAGSITAEHVQGRLQTGIAGSGRVNAKTAALDQLDAEISGAGTITVAGEAEQAQLTIAGAGTIRVDKVAAEPAIQIAGAGRIIVGNWRHLGRRR